MKKIIREIIPYIIIIIVVIAFRTFIATPVIVNGDSMKTTLFDGEVLILNKISYRFNEIKRYDIVVIDESLLEKNVKDKLIIKRIIGLPGDKVEYKDGSLYINDKEVEDKYAKTETKDFDMHSICNCSIIPDNSYLVLGDNREVSKDSRIIGLINKKYIKGKVNFRIFPLDSIGKVK